MRIKYFVILLIILSCFYSFSNPCADELSGLSNKFQSAGEVFISYVHRRVGEDGVLKMGSHWKKSIVENTQHWEVSEAENFLDFLQERIGEKKTIDRLKAPSLFAVMKYQSFFKYVHLYERYIGEEGVNDNLSKSLKGFDRGSLDRVEKFINFLEEKFPDKFGENWIPDNMEENILFVARGNKKEFSKVQDFMNENFGEVFTDELIKKHPVSFSQARLKQLRPVLNFLKGYLEEEDLQHVLENNISVLIEIQINQFKPAVELLEEYIGKEETVLKIRKSLSTLRLAQRGHLKSVIRFVEKRIGRTDVRAKLIHSIHGFNRISVAHLQSLEEVWERITMENNLRRYGLRHEIFNNKPDSKKTNQTTNKLNQFNKNMDILEGYFKQEDLAQLAKKDIDSIFEASPNILKTAIETMANIFDYDDVIRMLISDLQKFIFLSEFISSFQTYLKPDQWIEIFNQKDVKGLRELKSIFNLMLDYVGEDEMRSLLNAHLQSILNMELEIFQKTVYAIKKRLGKDGLNEVLQNRFYIFL